MFPRADYDSHPAFASHCWRAPSTDGFAKLNGLTDEIVSEFVLTDCRHERLIAENINKYDELLGSDAEIDHSLVEPLKRAFRSAHRRLIGEKKARIPLLTGESHSVKCHDNAEQLYRKGYFVTQTPADILRQLQNLLGNDMNAQRQAADQHNGEINYYYPKDPEVHALIRRHFEEAGVFESISAFYGRTYDRVGVVLHYSSPHDTWQSVFDDLRLPKARTHLLHFDYSFVVPKAMVYLNDIGVDNGVFSVIPHEVPSENICFDLAFANEFLTEFYQVAETDFGWKPRGNESIFRWPKARELFASLPHSLRVWPNVGDHIADGSELSKDLLAREAKLTGPAGTIAVFLGSHVMHRGGTAAVGERFALQATFQEKLQEATPEPVRPPQPQLQPSWWERLRRLKGHG
jgi:hypothetical protein